MITNAMNGECYRTKVNFKRCRAMTRGGIEAPSGGKHGAVIGGDPCGAEGNRDPESK